MESEIIQAIIAHEEGHIAVHKANIEICLQNPVGIGEHPDLISSIGKELDCLSKHEGRISVIREYFDEHLPFEDCEDCEADLDEI
tara:strand:- start:723 stop:977 length:255 start_codon:yes stop_codon:yes gene_type:complete